MNDIETILARVNREVYNRAHPEDVYKETADGLNRLKNRLKAIDASLLSLKDAYGDDLGFDRGIDAAIELADERKKLLARKQIIKAYLNGGR